MPGGSGGRGDAFGFGGAGSELLREQRVPFARGVGHRSLRGEPLFNGTAMIITLI